MVKSYLYNAANDNVYTTLEPSDDSNVVRIIVCNFFLLISSTLLLTLNPLCLLVLRHINSIHDTTKVFLRSMTVADLGVGIFMALPMTVTVNTQHWPFGLALCTIQPFVVISAILGSVLSLLLLTVDRYISVVYALRYHSLVTVKRARIAVCCVWGLTVALITGAGFISHWHIEYNTAILMCYFISKYSILWAYLYMVYISATLCCLLALLVAYTRLFVITRQHARRIRADNEIAQDGHIPDRRGKKALHTLLLMVLATCIGTIIPATCVSQYMPSKNRHYAFFLIIMPNLTNSWLNTVIYYLRNKEFRQATKTLLKSYYASFQRVIQCKGNTN